MTSPFDHFNLAKLFSYQISFLIIARCHQSEATHLKGERLNRSAGSKKEKKERKIEKLTLKSAEMKATPKGRETNRLAKERRKGRRKEKENGEERRVFIYLSI